MKLRFLLALSAALITGTILWWRGPFQQKRNTDAPTEPLPTSANARAPAKSTIAAGSPSPEPGPATQDMRFSENKESKALQELTPLEKCRYRGSATPEDTLETMCWAALSGNDDVLAGTLYVKEKYNARLTEIWATLNEETKAKYKSPQHVLSMLFAKEVLTHCVALRCTTSIQPDGREAELIVDMKTEQGHKQRKMPMVNVEGTWKVPILSGQVDRLSAMLAELK